MNNKVDIQFRYVLKYANVWCQKCGKTITLTPNNRNQIDDFVCTCGLEYKIPHHYIDTYHNKQAKIVGGTNEK